MMKKRNYVGSADEIDRLFEWGKGDRSVAIRIPATGTHLEDRRPAANINPYTAVNSLLKSLIRAEKSHGRQNASKRTKRKTATVA